MGINIDLKLGDTNHYRLLLAGRPAPAPACRSDRTRAVGCGRGMRAHDLHGSQWASTTSCRPARDIPSVDHLDGSQFDGVTRAAGAALRIAECLGCSLHSAPRALTRADDRISRRQNKQTTE